MLLTLNERNLCINCDWLSFSVKIDPMGDVIAPKGYRFDKFCGTNVFKERWILSDKSGNKIMTFCCNPFSSALKDDIATCQIANQYLYNPNPERLESLLSYFKKAKFNGLSRWDVCCDFNPTDAEYKTIRKLTEGSQYVSGKSEGSIFWHSEKYGEKEFRMAHCMSWGSKSSFLKIKLYNKSLEINAANKELCSKPYIREEWENHLENINNVWRLEFSLTDVNQFGIDGRRLLFSDSLSSDILCRFFSEVKAKRFIVRKNQGRRKGHKNEDEIVPFLPFCLENLTIHKAKPISERSPLDEERALARHLWVHLQDMNVLCDETRYTSIRTLLCELAENPIISGYLDTMCNGSFCKWLDETDNYRGMGVFDLSNVRYS